MQEAIRKEEHIRNKLYRMIAKLNADTGPRLFISALLKKVKKEQETVSSGEEDDRKINRLLECAGDLIRNKKLAECNFDEIGTIDNCTDDTNNMSFQDLKNQHENAKKTGEKSECVALTTKSGPLHCYSQDELANEWIKRRQGTDPQAPHSPLTRRCYPAYHQFIGRGNRTQHRTQGPYMISD